MLRGLGGGMLVAVVVMGSVDVDVDVDVGFEIVPTMSGASCRRLSIGWIGCGRV